MEGEAQYVSEGAYSYILFANLILVIGVCFDFEYSWSYTLITCLYVFCTSKNFKSAIQILITHQNKVEFIPRMQDWFKILK